MEPQVVGFAEMIKCIILNYVRLDEKATTSGDNYPFIVHSPLSFDFRHLLRKFGHRFLGIR